MPKDFSFLEEASKVVVGKTNNFRIQWNSVSLGDNDVIVERPAMSLDQIHSRKNFDTGAASPAYEKKEYKARCTLCRMWFEKSSVSYKVSNHRLIGLRQQHGEIESGRRYTNASYMYRFVNVCVFCSQLFDEEYKVSKKPEDVLTLPPKKEPVVKTELLRMNIAPNHRCYMSSVVDNLTAERALSRAVSINGTVGARSRREVDPWWEIDLDRTHHIESITIEVLGGLQIHVPVVCMLLKKPVGFENPFLAQIENKAVTKEEFTMPELPHLETHKFTWKLPPRSNGRAVRIQMRQIHTLQLLSIQIYQGDEFLPPTEEDLEITKQSFATTNLEHFRKAKREFDKEMYSGRPKTTSNATKNSHLDKHQRRELDIIDLNKTMRNRQRLTEQWEMALVLAARSFTVPELEALWEFVFAPGYPRPLSTLTPVVASREGERGRSTDSYAIRDNRSRSRSPGGGDGAVVSPSQLPGSRGMLQDSEIKELSSLTASYPASGLDDIHARLKHVLFTINMKDKNSAKKLGILCQMPLMVELAEDVEEQLHLLKIAIDAVHEAASPISQAALARMCKWGEFVYIIHLLSQGQASQIPHIVFGVEKDTIRSRRSFSADDDQWMNGDLDGRSADEQDAFAVAHGHGISMGGSKHRTKIATEERNQASNDLGALVMGRTLDELGSPEGANPMTFGLNTESFGESFGESPGRFGSRLNSRSQTSLSGGSSSSFTRSGRPDMTPLTTSLRKKGVRPPDANFFQQYKLNNMVKKQEQIDVLEFPKHLTSDFTQIFLDSQSPIKRLDQKPVIVDDDDGMFEINDEVSVSSKRSEETRLSSNSKAKVPPKFVLAKKGPKAFKPAETMTEILTSNPVLGSLVAQSNKPGGATRGGGLLEKYGISADGDEKKKKKGAFFKRICALCNVQFPKDSVTSSVIFKHIVTLRRHWDPKLVSDQVILLEQNMSMYNLVPVCVFCAQFFDPDFPGGIALPSFEAVAPKQNLYESIVHPIKPKSDRNLSRPQTADGLVVTRPGSENASARTKTLNIPIMSKRGTILGPVKFKQKMQKSKPVHMLPKMDTRYEIGNTLEQLNSPVVKEKRRRAKESIDILQSQLKQIEEEQEKKMMAIKAADEAFN